MTWLQVMAFYARRKVRRARLVTATVVIVAVVLVLHRLVFGSNGKYLYDASSLFLHTTRIIRKTVYSRRSQYRSAVHAAAAGQLAIDYRLRNVKSVCILFMLHVLTRKPS